MCRLSCLALGTACHQSCSGLLAKKQELHQLRGLFKASLFTHLWKRLLFYFSSQVPRIIWPNSVIDGILPSLGGNGFIQFLKTGKMNAQSYLIIFRIPTCHPQSTCPYVFLDVKDGVESISQLSRTKSEKGTVADLTILWASYSQTTLIF